VHSEVAALEPRSGQNSVTACQGGTHSHPLAQKPAPGSMMQGGAIYFRYCGSKVPYLSKNTFSGNSATMFNGQIGCALLWCIQTTA